MTLEEKLGQVTQVEQSNLKPGEIGSYKLGSLLTGGDSVPGDGGPASWAAMTDKAHAEARATRLHIPLLFASDAIHGHSNVIGATVFPHQIGLGATRDPALVERVGQVTATEMTATGVDWTFTPMVGAARDDRWGRTVESFSESPELVGRLGAALILGLQTRELGSTPTSVLATAKHFAGDGDTVFGTADTRGMDAENPVYLDRGDVRLSDAEFAKLALAQYQPAIDRGVGSVMISLSMFRGKKALANRRLATEILRDRMGFAGIRISDYESIRWIPGATLEDKVALAFNAGADMTMEAERWRELHGALTAAAKSGKLPVARLDDAVRRVLRTKCQLGLFERKTRDAALLAKVGAPEHRAVARTAVQKSLVLLKNEHKVLPLARTAKVHVMGMAGDSLNRQCGGWTVSWEGAGEKAKGTTLFQALSAASPGNVTRSDDGAGAAAADALVVVLAETPYAEWIGDRKSLLLPPEEVKLLETAKRAGKPTVVVLFSGRPLVITPQLPLADAWVAAWLPGTEGGGLADVLYGDVAPTGKLGFSWPKRDDQQPINVGDAGYDPLFPFGYGLTYESR